MSAAPSPKKKGKNGLLTFLLIVGIFFTVTIGLKKIPAMLEEKSPVTVQITASGASVSDISVSASTSEPVELYVRKPLGAPAHTADWSREIGVPSGYRPMFCEADESLACTSTESDLASVRFEFNCRDLKGTASVREQEADLVSCRVRAKGDSPLTLAYWFEPYQNVP